MENKKKEILIIFSGPHLAYSPTTINLYDFLSSYFKVTVFAEDPGNFNNKKPDNRTIIYYKQSRGLKRYVNRILFEIIARFKKDAKLFKKKKIYHGIYFNQYLFLEKYLKRSNFSHVIAIDFQNLFFCQLLEKKVEFVSLEIMKDEMFFPECSFSNIRSVIIQSKERYEYVFGDKKIRTFYIQNAPVFKPIPEIHERNGLIYCGTAWDPFGFYHCLEYLKKYPLKTMTVQGVVFKEDRDRISREYENLLGEKRLTINDEYIEEPNVLEFLSGFRIGFCFYNFEVPRINNFNYYSAPSGKLFKYLAAGVPVIGQNIIGLQCVREFDCGILIEDMKPESIQTAIETIEQDFEKYSKNCLKAARNYSFDKTVQPFITYLLNSN